MTLSEIKCGALVKIVSIDSDWLKVCLMERGFIKDKLVKKIYTLHKNGPYIFEVDSVLYALRKDESNLIKVKKPD